MVLQGYLEHFLFRNEDNGYTVFNLAMEKEDVICVGFFKSIEQGETLELVGDFITHNVYGEQFKVEDYKIIPPQDRVAMERYLGSGAIKGVGEALAKRIIKAAIPINNNTPEPTINFSKSAIGFCVERMLSLQ